MNEIRKFPLIDGLHRVELAYAGSTEYTLVKNDGETIRMLSAEENSLIVSALASALEYAAMECEIQMGMPECPERAQYCADAIRKMKPWVGATAATFPLPQGEADGEGPDWEKLEEAYMARLAQEENACHPIPIKAEPTCPNCDLPMSTNPHPDAGKPVSILEVNTQRVCIPCLTLNRHKWALRANEAEGQLIRLARAESATPSLPPQGEAQADGDALPCPFCAAIAWVYEDWTHAVNCSGCKAQGPSHYDKGVAIDAWNRRAAIAPQGQQAKAVAVHVINNLARHHGHRHDPNGDYTFSLKQIHAFANAVAIAAQALPVADTASADAPKQMFLVSFVGLRGERGIWREATEKEFNTFTPAYRRKVQVIDAAQPLPVADTASAGSYSNLTVEQRFAVRQAENIGASDSYFKARTHFMDTYTNRNIFEAGFYSGWDALKRTQGSGA